MTEAFLTRLKKADTPFFRTVNRTARKVLHSRLPVPRFAFPLFRGLFQLHTGVGMLVRRLYSYLYVEPVFRGRCESLGERFHISRVPFVVGPTKIHIGDDVRFFGKVDIFSGRILENPTLILKDRVDIGHNVVFVVNKEIIIEEDVNVASGVRFMDTDSHPRDTAARIADLGPPPDEIKPVRIGRYAWIGQNSFILKGVTIGEGAIIGVNSVVVSDIPPYAVAMGNPARVVLKDSRKPASL